MATDQDQGPGARRRYLGKALRRMREALKLSAAEVAKQVRISQPAITRIEGGRNAILLRHVAKLLELYGASDDEVDRLMRIAEQANERGWWESYSDVVQDWFAVYASLEADATEIAVYEAEFVPGLFQIPNYVRAVRLAAHPDTIPEQLERAVQLRRERQQQLNGHVTCVLGEAVVARQVGGRVVMRDQLRRLIEEIDRGHDIRMLPFEAGAHAAMTGSFTLLRFPDTDGMDLAYTENERGGMYLERPSHLVRYVEVFERIEGMAMTSQTTREHLVTLVDAQTRAE